MKQYLSILKEVKEKGVQKPSGRENMPDVLGLTHGTILMDLQEGFPLLTTKKMFWKGIVHELLWFMRGDTNIKYLVDNNVNIWNKDAYGWYLKVCKENDTRAKYSFESFVNEIYETMPGSVRGRHRINNYGLGDLGKVYGHQWRDQNGIDQLKNIFKALRDNPYARYKILDAWNAKDIPEMALPPCHLLYQFLVEPIPYVKRAELLWASDAPEHVKEGDMIEESNTPKFYLDLNMYQRSCDMVLGVPFNIASMSFLLSIMAKALNMVPRYAYWTGGHCDIYMEHLPQVEEQLSRTPYQLPSLNIKKNLNSFEDILSLTIEDFDFHHYTSHPAIKSELFTGLAK